MCGSRRTAHAGRTQAAVLRGSGGSMVTESGGPLTRTSPGAPTSGVRGWIWHHRLGGAFVGFGIAYAVVAVAVAWWGTSWPWAVHPGWLRWAWIVGVHLVIPGGFGAAWFQWLMARVVRPLQYQVAWDTLTGLLRADAFWPTAEAVIQAATATGRQVAFAFCDLDNFKVINDTAGHLVGDAVLRATGQILREESRKEDVLGRVGGEELAWVLPGAGKAEALRAVERVLQRCRSTPIEGIGGWDFSAGIAVIEELPPIARRVEPLAQLADQRLYYAKANGKGRIETDSPVAAGTVPPRRA